MNGKITKLADKRRPLEQLVEIADTLFARGTQLLNPNPKKDGQIDEAQLEQIGRETLAECVSLWEVVLELMPSATMDQSHKKALSIDAHKVISRCFHKLGNLEQARVHIARAIDEGYNEGFISLGAICIDLNDMENAETAFRTAINKDVLVTRARAGLGELYFAMGMEKLKTDPHHTEYFAKAEEAFVEAGKAKFTGGFERAMDLFETIGWGDKVLSIGERAASFYDAHKSTYGEKIRALNIRVRKIAGEERHDKIVQGAGRKLGKVLGNTESEQ